METFKLRYFYTVAKLQHVTKAAEELCIAQPALTQAIKALEKELGVSLFVKKGRNIVLTEFGEYLKNRLDNLLPEFDKLPTEIEQMKNRVTNTIKLNILAASTFVINAIMMYRKNHPNVVFDFEQNEQKYSSDIVVTTNGIDGRTKKNYVKRCVKPEKIYLAVPKNSIYADYVTIDLKVVKDESFVMFSNSRLFGVICNKFCSIAGFTPKILFESDSPVAVQNIISTGTGVAFWPEYSWGRIKNKNVVLLPISDPICQRELIIELYSRTPKSEYAEDFYEYLLKQV
ncbi:MAG: LysR family transcriptional regulator [Clostridia bacterium]|nr:LysR family transcriptional regulator [Clostridia bacterium]